MRGFGVTALGFAVLVYLYYTMILKKYYNNFGLLPRKEMAVMSVWFWRAMFAIATGIIAGVISNAIYAMLAG